MARRHSPTLFHPTPVPGQHWLAFQLQRSAPAYPKVVCNTLYYRVPLGLSLPVHAKQAALDFTATTAWTNLRLITAALSSVQIAAIYLYDGAVLHTFPFINASLGFYPLAMTGRALGVSITKRSSVSFAFPQVTGRTFISPIPMAYLAGGDRLTVGAVADLTNLALSLFHDTFVSEGNTWQPAIFSFKQDVLRPLKYATLVPRITQLRRRLRVAPWVAQLVLPPAFPTATG